MTKEKLIEVLEKLNIPVNEGVTHSSNINKCPRVVFWDYLWEDQMASGNNFNILVTYQISFYSNTSRDMKLIELKQLLNHEGIHPIISHEYIEKDRVFHSFMAIEVMEDVLFKAI